MRVLDENNVFLRIASEIDNLGRFFLVSGCYSSKSKSINVIEAVDLNNTIEYFFNDSELRGNNNYLLRSISKFINKEQVYFFTYTHPLQTKENLSFTDDEISFFEYTCKQYTKTRHNLPLVFCALCSDKIKFKIYFNGEVFDDVELDIDTKYSLNMWDFEILVNQSYNNSILYHSNSNSAKIVSIDTANKIDRWKKLFNANKLSNLEEVAFKHFVLKTFDYKDFEVELATSKNLMKTGEISDLRLMVQVGCNLKCKYCYADEGTYGYSNNIVMTEVNGKKILDKLVENGIKLISNISFFGGEPSIYPKTIKTVCDYSRYLFDKGKLHSMPVFYMVTNGTVFSDELIQTVKKFDIKLTISLDGPSYIHDKLRIDKDGHGTYDIILSNISKLRQNNIEPTMIETTYTTIHEKYDLTRNETKRVIDELVSIPTVYLADCEGSEFTPNSKSSNDIDEIIDSIDELFKDISGFKDNAILGIVSGYVKQLYNKKVKNNIFCSAGYSMMSVMGNGDYYPCHRFMENEQFRTGNLFNQSLNSSYKRNLLKDDIDDCKLCWATQFCNECTFELIKNKQKRLQHCKDKRKLIKYVLIRYVNLNEEEKQDLNTIICKSSIKKHQLVPLDYIAN